MREPSPIDLSVERYRALLRSALGARQLARFDSRLSDEQCEAGAAFEAVVFSVAGSLGWNPAIHEVPGRGGPDFICSTANGRVDFMLEATCLDAGAQADRIMVPHPLPVDDRAHTYSISMDQKKIRGVIRSKSVQLGGHPMPRVLAVGSFHSHANAVLGDHGCWHLLLSDHLSEKRLGFCPDSKDYPSEEPDGRREYAFFQWTISRGWEPLSLPVSAVLQVAVLVSRCALCGVLHPAPARPLDPVALAPVPIVRLTSWPPPGTPADGDPPWTMLNTDTMLPLDISLDSA